MTTQTAQTPSADSDSPHDRDLMTVEHFHACVKQSAAFLQLSQSSISRECESIRLYIRQGHLKAFRVAGLRKVLIARDELMKLLQPA